MLKNLIASEDIPSPQLISDMRTLCSLSAEELRGIAEAFESIPDTESQGSFREALFSKIRPLEIDSEKLSSSIGVTLFLWDQWGSLGLTKEQVLADFKSLNLSKDQLTNLKPLLDALQLKLGALLRRRAEAGVLDTGTPQIDSAHTVIDARAIFKSSTYDEDRGEKQAYFEFDRFIPIAILEIVSELNDDKSTQAYLLTESTLEQLCGILDRTRKRLKILNAQLPTPSDQGGDDYAD